MNNWTRVLLTTAVGGGILVIGVVMIADWIGLLGSPGIALKQALLGLAGVGILLSALGLAIRRPPEIGRFLDRHAKALIVATLVVVVISGLSVAILGVSRLVGLTTTCDALPLLRDLISIEYPEMRDPQLDDWEKVKLLRSWTYTHVDWGSQCAQMNHEQYRRFFDADVATSFSMFYADEGAVMCTGTAWALERLYRAYGYEAYNLGVDIPGVMGHDMTLVRISYNGRSILTVQDATFDISYVAPDGEPYDYFDLLAVVENRHHDLVEIEQGACTPGDFLFCADEEFAEQQYWSVPGDAPVPALSQGRMKVEFGLTIDNWWDFYGAAIADSFAQAGYPPHLCYMFLNLLYIKQGYEDAPELMERATSILDQSPP